MVDCDEFDIDDFTHKEILDVDDGTLKDIDNSDESMEEAKNWAASEEGVTICLPVCTVTEEMHRNFSLSYYEEGKPSYVDSNYQGQTCKDCEKMFVFKPTPGKEDNEFKPSPSKPLHACLSVRCGRVQCEHIYCHPCFHRRLTEVSPKSPRKKRSAAVHNVRYY